MYQTTSPILFIVFNRPHSTSLVFDRIRNMRPSKLYIAADGPRPDRPLDQSLCQQTRDLLKIDWPCEVHTLYREQNLGCKLAVSGAIKWFFNHEEEGIILEDDCLPNESFFRFCDLLLERYRHDTRIVHISGTCLGPDRKFGKASYYFSKITNIWGWASWRRSWESYDENLLLLDNFLAEDLFKYVYPKKAVTNKLVKSLLEVQDTTLNTWDVQYAFLNFWNNGLSINPNVNMVSNIGFNGDGTHTHDNTHQFANIPLEELREIVHPDFFVPLVDADYYSYSRVGTPLTKRIGNKLKRIIGLNSL